MQGVPLSIPGIDQIFSGVILSIQTSSYGILTLEEQPSSMVHQHMDLLPIKLIITLVSLGIVIFLVQKRFKRFIFLHRPKISGSIGKDALSLMEVLILPNC